MKASPTQTRVARHFLTAADQYARNTAGRSERVVEKSAEAIGNKILCSRVVCPVHGGETLRNVRYHKVVLVGPRGGLDVILDHIE